jgi:hypothetical protein
MVLAFMRATALDASARLASATTDWLVARLGERLYLD